MPESNQKKSLCRFDLFVRLHANQVQRFPNRSLTWCYRGDKFTTVEDEMLGKVLRLFIKSYSSYQIAIIRDNSKATNDPSRTVLMWCNGVVEENRLLLYHESISKIILPAWLK